MAVCLAVVVVGIWMVPAAFVLGVAVIRFLTFSTICPFRTHMIRAWTTPRALCTAVMGVSLSPPWIHPAPRFRRQIEPARADIA